MNHGAGIFFLTKMKEQLSKIIKYQLKLLVLC